MSRRKRTGQSPLRLPTDASHFVSQLATSTGWSANEALAFIVHTGWNALNCGSDKVPAFRQVMTAAIAHHETEIAMRKRLGITESKLRDARSALSGKTGGAT